MLGCLQILIDFSCLNTFLKEKEESAQRQQLPIRRGQRLAVGMRIWFRFSFLF